eukprot:3430784-Prymnesium_polylepis.1
MRLPHCSGSLCNRFASRRGALQIPAFEGFPGARSRAQTLDTGAAPAVAYAVLVSGTNWLAAGDIHPQPGIQSCPDFGVPSPSIRPVQLANPEELVHVPRGPVRHILPEKVVPHVLHGARHEEAAHTAIRMATRPRLRPQA